MDSGLGSDEDRRGRTKEQKQLRNQQLLSGCFIDAASLSDESEIASDQRRNDERRQGALIFQNSIPNFSMLQMGDQAMGPATTIPSSVSSSYPETSTPYNSIVHLDIEEETSRKTPLGFYVDLKDVPDVPAKTPTNGGNAKKNIFSMVIDFEAPKKDKPIKLSSSLISFKKNKQSKHLTLTARQNGNSSLSSSLSSISSVAGPSRLTDDDLLATHENGKRSIHHKKLKDSSSSSSKSSSSTENIADQKNEHEESGNVSQSNVDDDDDDNDDKKEIASPPSGILDDDLDVRTPPIIEDTRKFEFEIAPSSNIVEDKTPTGKKEMPVLEEKPQFVKLSDLECQKPKLDLGFTPRMSKSIPESSWVESPLLMSRSAGYRSAPHPLEPESDDLSDSGSITDTSVSQPRRSVQRLGTDLLRMFLEEIGPDVTVEVDGHKLKAHKCILASRCQYFAALLSGNWLEASGNVICLQGFSYESVYFALCHIYSGAAHVPDSISLVELASLSDMLGLEGLKEVVEHALKQRHCHNFHKPCAGCCTGVLEVLPLSAAYGLDDLYQKCLQWITQHFVRVWPSRGFASLPRELREKCYQQHVVHMTADKVLETIVNCDKILATLPALRWAEPINQLVLQLSDACHLYHRQHFSAVMGAPSFLALDAGLGWDVARVVDQMMGAASNLGVEQACRSYSRCCKMLEQTWSKPFSELLERIKVQLEQCLVKQADRLIRSNAWLRLDSALRCRIKDLTPLNEPVSRLPRATPRRSKNPTVTKPRESVSSSDSSRNSSPGMNQIQNKSQHKEGSPSLRRSLLLAARAPQVPPSPSMNRKSSTLTQPTASSAAKSAPSKNIKSRQPPAQVQARTAPLSARGASQINQNQGQKVRNVSAVSRVQAARKAASQPQPQTVAKNKKPISRSGSPCLGPKVENRAGSPRKLGTSASKPDVRCVSPKKSPTTITKKASPKKSRENINNEPEVKVVPIMQRSSTFLKDEPTVMGKLNNM